jgi:hypothetical protein
MAVVKIYKETTLPATVEANSIYLVAPAAKPNYLELYVTSSDGSQVRRVITDDDVLALSGSGVRIVDTIADRDAITPKANGMLVYVLDATGDSTVSSGAASYLWRESTTQWVKLTEYESMDVSVQWSSIQGRPASTPAAIDSAVAASHAHANATELAQIGQDGSGNLTYGGLPPRARLETAGW